MYWIIGAVLGLLVIAACWMLGPKLRRRRALFQLAAARVLFTRRREWLEADFEKLGGQSGLPRGLAWAGCEFENNVAFAKDRNTGQLRALVGVAIRFTAIAGGGMEENPNVGNLRAATAVFHFDGRQWSTDGRALFNVNPRQAIERFRHELELVE